MKTFYISLCFLFSGTLLAQFPNWGWGPAINTSLAGNTLTCTAYDPIQAVVETTTVSSVSSYINNEGIVAWLTTGGNVGGITYDINQQNWESAIIGSNGNTIYNNDGVIAWLTTGGNVGGAVYDPGQQNWEYAIIGSNGSSVSNNDGVIAWLTTGGNIGGAVYDPAQQNWEYAIVGSNGSTFFNTDGVISWQTTGGNVGGAVYNPGLQNWEYSILGSNASTVLNNSGVIAWLTTGGNVGGAVYDPVQENWEYTILGSNATGVSITDGTIFWTTTSGTNNSGFNKNTQNWTSGYNTDLYCKLFVSSSGGMAPLITYFWCLTYGANSYSYACGDGHTINRRWAFKQYTNPGNYNPVLTIFNSSNNSACDENITVLTGIEQISNLEGEVYPNPASNILFVDLDQKGVVEFIIYEVTGKVVKSNHLMMDQTENFIDISGLTPGIYFIDFYTSTDLLRRKIIIQ
jgi:hypothetical protein